ncbi:MAG: copper resistance protein CopC [Gemmatimonadaceae bacterium]
MRTKASLIAATLGLALLDPSKLHGHPVLKRSDPAAGAALQSSPSAIALHFSEAPELAMTTVLLRGPRGIETLTDLAIDAVDRFQLSAKVLRELMPGRYTVTWRTAASDGHPVQGIFAFTVLGTSPDSPSVPGTTQAAADSAETDLQTPFQILLRALSFIALIAVIGAVTFRGAVVPRIRDLNAEVRTALLDRCALVGAISALVLLFLAPVRFQFQAILMADHLMDDRMQTLMMQTRWGTAWILATAGASVALAGFIIARLRYNLGWLVASAGSVALAFSPALSGHAGASPRLAMFAIAVDAVHIIGAAGWLGSLLYVVVAGLPTFGIRENGALNVAKLVNAFSPTALGFAGLVVVSGVLSAWLRLGTLSALWMSPYGRVLLLKLFVLSGVIATGAYNWRRMRPTLGVEAATAKFQWSSRLELSIGLAVIVITAILVATPTP